MTLRRTALAMALCVLLIIATAITEIAPANLGYAAEEQQTNAVETESATNSTLAAPPSTLLEGTCEKQEVVYASMTAAGAVKSLYVVNELFSEEPVMVKDFGTYSEVVNLTDGTNIARESDSVLCTVESESFAYQGNLTSTDLPWNVSITYELDGKVCSPEEVAGKSGELKITIETTQNQAIDPLYFDNYLLQITCTLPMDHVSNIATDEGSIALNGSSTAVTFSGMPGKTGSYALTAHVEDFEMEGVSIAAIPFSMAIEAPDSRALIAQFDELIEGTGKLDTGAEGLEEGTTALVAGTHKLKSGTAQLQGGAQELSAGVAAYVAGAAQISDGLAQAAAGSKTFAEQLEGLSQASAAIVHSLDQAQTQMQQLVNAIQTSPTMSQAEKDTIVAQLSGMSGQFSQLKDYAAGVEGLADGYAPLDSSLTKLSGGLSELAQRGDELTSGSAALDAGVSELAGSSGSLAQGAGKLSEGVSALVEGTSKLHEESATIPDKVQAEIDAMMAEYDKSDFVPKSFADERNTNVNLVQFVMTTEAIALPEPEPEEVQETDESLLSRFFALFS